MKSSRSDLRRLLTCMSGAVAVASTACSMSACLARLRSSASASCSLGDGAKLTGLIYYVYFRGSLIASRRHSR